jgi:hypothetical protein
VELHLLLGLKQSYSVSSLHIASAAGVGIWVGNTVYILRIVLLIYELTALFVAFEFSWNMESWARAWWAKTIDDLLHWVEL